MGRYRRTVSFPHPNPTVPRPSAKSLHVRSASLPCARSNPLIPQLRDEVNELKTWSNRSESNRVESGRVIEGLARLKGVLDSLDDVLQLPQAQDSLSSNTPLVERLLEDFLKFVDSYGLFQAAMLGLKQEISSAQLAARRRDSAQLGLHVKAQKKIAGEIERIASTIRSVGPTPELEAISTVDCDYFNNGDEEIKRVIRDVHGLTSSVTSGVFGAVSGSFGLGRRPMWMGWRGRKEEEGIEEIIEVVEGVEGLVIGLRVKKENQEEERVKKEKMRVEVLKRMQELEDCVGEMEKGSERVFRSLISTRVSLLNILTHA